MARIQYVYFLKPVGMDGPIKIGSSIYPKSRLDQLQSWTWLELELVAESVGGIEAERLFQKRFQKDRIRGEWFSASDELLRCIEKINSGIEAIEALND